MTKQRFRGRARNWTLLLALVAFVPLAGCRSVSELDSGTITTVFEEEIEAGDMVQLSDFDLEDFDSLDISSSFEVDVVQGDRFEVVVRASESVAEHVRVERKDSTLHLGLESSGLLGLRVRNVELEAMITMPELVDVDLSGASTLRFGGFDSSATFNIDVSGASSINGELSAGDTEIDASGASSVTLNGEGGDLQVDASGASSVDLSGYVVADAEVDASGASNVEVNANGQLDAEAQGAADVRYGGAPQLGEIRTSGAGSVGER